MKFKTIHKKKFSSDFWWWLLAILVNLVLSLIWFKYFFTLGQADLLASAALSGQNIGGLPMTTNKLTDLKHAVAIDYNEAASLWPLLSESSVKIFRPQDGVSVTIGGKTDKLFNLDKPLATAWVVTSDGWLVSSYDLADWLDLVVVSNDHKIYSIDKKSADPLTGLVFYHLKGVNNLTPLKLGENSWHRPGQLFYNLDGRGGFQAAWLEKNNYNQEESLIVNSDSLRQRWQFSATWPHSALFTGKGELFGIVNKEDEFVPVNYIKSGFTSLLSDNTFQRVSLGVDYIDLNQLSLSNQYGLLIDQVMKDSPADKAGVKAGDILLSIDEINLDTEVSINEILQHYRPRSRASLVVQRAGQNYQLTCQF